MKDVCNNCSNEMELIARQAAHDLRSPLSVLKLLVATEFTPENAEEIRTLANAVVKRIESIAADLVRDAKREPHTDLESADAVLAEIHNEKSAEHGEAEIKVMIDKQICEYLIPAPGLKRALSNLVNNAVEAGARNITLRALALGSEIEISVKDDGSGMPAAVSHELNKAIPELVTYGKADGQGLGFLHLRRLAQGLGGWVKIDSKQGAGTDVRIRLPRLYSEV